MRIKRIEDATPEDIERLLDEAFKAVFTRRYKHVRDIDTDRRVGD